MANVGPEGYVCGVGKHILEEVEGERIIREEGGMLRVWDTLGKTKVLGGLGSNQRTTVGTFCERACGSIKLCLCSGHH